MLESLRIIGFRKFENLNIENLGRVNILLGNNNLGKTTILEAIFAWACGQNIPPFINIGLARGRYFFAQSPYWMMEELLACAHDRSSFPLQMAFDGVCDGKQVRFDHTIFPSDLLSELGTAYNVKEDYRLSGTNGADSQPLTLSGLEQRGNVRVVPFAHWIVKQNNENEFKVDITMPIQQTSVVEPFQSGRFVDLLAFTSVAETVQLYGTLKRQRLMNEVIRPMKAVFPEIAGFDMIPYPDGSQAPVSIVKEDGTTLPIYSFGDGVQKWFFLIGTMVLYKNSIVCIDEIDAGFHPAAQKEFYGHLIRAAVDNQVQLFLTTHNLEFVDNALASVQGMEPELHHAIRIITLRETEGGIQMRNLAAEEALRGRELYKLELR